MVMLHNMKNMGYTLMCIMNNMLWNGWELGIHNVLSTIIAQSLLEGYLIYMCYEPVLARRLHFFLPWCCWKRIPVQRNLVCRDWAHGQLTKTVDTLESLEVEHYNLTRELHHALPLWHFLLPSSSITSAQCRYTTYHRTGLVCRFT